MLEFEARVTQVTVLPVNAPVFHDMVTRISITDEGGGEYVSVEQSESQGEIKITAEEWPELKKQIDRMICRCRDRNND